MCRLCAITTTQLVDGGGALIDIKAQLMHECMMRSSHEEGGQKDGWGVTDMLMTWKNTSWYFEDTPTWLNDISTDDIIMSHLRKASAGTGRTVRDNHPYEFDVNGEQLTALHNGFFDGAGWTNWSADTPNTDSYRALNALVGLLQESDNGDITPEMISEWLSVYTDASHYALMIHWRGVLHIMRGNTRTLHALQLGNGYLVHTSLQVLDQMRQYVRVLYGIDTPASVIVPVNTLVKLKPGSILVSSAPLNIRHVPTQSYQTRWDTNVHPKANVIVPASNQGSDISGADNSIIVAPSVTPRLARTDAGLEHLMTRPLQPPATFTLRERRRRWSLIAGELSPLRKELSTFWAASALGYVSETTHEPLTHTFRVYATEREFDLIQAIFLPRTVDGGFIKPFAPVAMTMINWWNHLVVPEYDADVHLTLFGTQFFWLNTYYTRMRDDDGKYDNTAVIMRAWIGYMLRTIESRLIAEQITKWLDVKTLSAIVDNRATALTLLKED